MEADRDTAKPNGAVATAAAEPAASAPAQSASVQSAPTQAPPAQGAPGQAPPAQAPPAQTISLSAMKEMSISALTKIAKELDIAGATGMRKQELIFEILRVRAEKSGNIFS